jgi:hypothetical protein
MENRISKLAGQIGQGASKRLIQLALAITVLLWTLPEMIRLGAVLASPKLGIGELEIAEVDLNLFSGKLVVEQLQLRREGESKLQLESLQLDLAWLALLDGVWRLEQLKLVGAALALQQRAAGWEVIVPLPVAGSDSETASQAGPLPKFDLGRLSIEDSRVQVLTDKLGAELLLSDLHVSDVSSWQNLESQLAMTGRWNKAGFSVQLSAQQLLVAPAIQGRLRLQGFDLQDLSTLLADQLQGLQGRLSIDSQFSLKQTAAGSYAISVQPNLELAGLSASYRHLDISNRQLHWRGQLEVSLPEPLGYQLTGSLAMEGFGVLDRQRSRQLASWQQLDIAELVLDQQNALSLSDFAVGQLRLLTEQQQSVLVIEKLTLDALGLGQDGRLELGSIAVTDGVYQLVLTEQGDILFRQQLAESLAGLGTDEPSATGGEAVEPPAESALRWRVEEISWLGDSHIYFTDRRFKPVVQQHLSVSTLQVGPVDQINPERPLQLKIEGALGEFSQLQLSGAGKPFLPAPRMQLQGLLENINLPSVSPYSEAVLGYELQSGQYDHRFTVDLKDQQIQLDNKLSLRQLTVSAVEGADSTLDQQLDVPLGLALDMLRDSDDNIHLAVPVSGRLDDPSVNINDVLNTALASAMKKGAVNYLKYALQPFGAVMMVGEMVSDQLGSVEFEPLLFEAGSVEITQPDYLDKLAGLMVARPSLELKLCGQSNLADQQLLAQQASSQPQKNAGQQVTELPEGELIQLAEQRSLLVKRAMLAAGVEAKRLYLCKPQFQLEGVSGVRFAM